VQFVDKRKKSTNYTDYTKEKKLVSFVKSVDKSLHEICG